MSSTAAAVVPAAIVTGSFTFLAGLVGVGLTQRHTRQLARDQRIEDRRSAVRDELVRLVVEVRALIETAWFLIPALGKMTFTDLNEFVNTDTGRDMARRQSQIRLSLTSLGVMVEDQPARSALEALTADIDSWGEKATGPATTAAPSAALVAVRDGFAHVRKTQASLDAVIAAMAPLVRISIADANDRPWWRRAASKGRRARRKGDAAPSSPRTSSGG